MIKYHFRTDSIAKGLILRKFFIVIGICFALTGCGSSSTNTPVTETLASFPNGAGVFRKDMVDPSAGSQGSTTKVLAYVPDLSKWVNDFSYADVSSIATHNTPTSGGNNFLNSGVDITNRGIGIGNPDVSILDEPYQFIVLKVASSSVYLTGGYDTNSQLIAVAFGPKATNLPSGNFSYTGYHGITTNLTNAGSDGLFTMNVNFSDGTGSYSANTTTAGATGLNGNITLDNTTGELSGTNLVLSGSLGGLDLTGKTATLVGNFHGDGATDVSGVFFTDNLDFAGGFLGNR